MKRRLTFWLVALFVVTAFCLTVTQMVSQLSDMASKIDDYKSEAEEMFDGASTAAEVSAGNIAVFEQDIKEAMDADAVAEAEFANQYKTTRQSFLQRIKDAKGKTETPPPFEPTDFSDAEAALKLTANPMDNEGGFVTMKEVLDAYAHLDANGVWVVKGKQNKCEHKCQYDGRDGLYKCNDHVSLNGLMRPQVRHMARLLKAAKMQGLFDSPPVPE